MNKELIEKYIEEGWLYKQVHPSLPLMILNYSDKCQYERFWNEITLKCRGLILDFSYNIIAQPFQKFFNIEEVEELPKENYIIEEKLDGSLGIAFWYENQWIFASRGSFTSEQAIKGFELFNKFEYGVTLNKQLTHCFEIIYPENRIVIDYNKERLVLLASLFEGKDTNFSNNFFDKPKTFTFSDNLREIRKYIKDSEEGYVIRYNSGFRVKIKGEEYLRLHKLCTQISNRDILEYLMKNRPIDELINKVPDEFFKFVQNTINDLKSRHEIMIVETENYRKGILNLLPKDYNRKDYASIAIKCNNSSLLFGLEDNKDISQMAWRLIKKDLEYKQPFRTNELINI